MDRLEADEVASSPRIGDEPGGIAGPAWGGADVPSDQWSEATVAGLPAAVGTTAMQGFGHSSVVVWDASTGISTAIKALDRPIEEVLKVAEEVIRQSS